MNRLQFERALESFAGSMLEVLDADGDQCTAWNRKGHDLIHAFAVATFEDVRAVPAKPEMGAPRVVRQCTTPPLGLPSSRDPEMPAARRCAVCGDYGMPGCIILPSGLCEACAAIADEPADPGQRNARVWPLPDHGVSVIGTGSLDEGGVRCGNCLDLGHSAHECPSGAPIL